MYYQKSILRTSSISFILSSSDYSEFLIISEIISNFYYYFVFLEIGGISWIIFTLFSKFGDKFDFFEVFPYIFYMTGDFSIFWYDFFEVIVDFYFITFNELICDELWTFGIIVLSAKEKSGTIPDLLYSAW